MGDWYILNAENEPVPTEMLEAAKWREENFPLCNVGDERFKCGKDEIRVSTKFLGMDHCYNDGPPVLFETMIFGGAHDQYQERYTSWKKAKEGHAIALVLSIKESEAK